VLNTAGWKKPSLGGEEKAPAFVGERGVYAFLGQNWTSGLAGVPKLWVIEAIVR